MNEMAYGRTVWALAVWCLIHEVRGSGLTLTSKYENITTAFNWFQEKLRRPSGPREPHSHHRTFSIMMDHLLHYASGHQLPSNADPGPKLIFNKPWQELHLIRALVKPALIAVRKSCKMAVSDGECSVRLRDTDMVLGLRCNGYKAHSSLRETLKHLVADPQVREIFFSIDAAANAELTDKEILLLMIQLVSNETPSLRSLKDLYQQVHPPNQFQVYPCVEMFAKT